MTGTDMEAQVEALFRHLDLPGRRLPLSTADVLQVLGELGYDVDLDRIREFWSTGRLHEPRLYLGEYRWQAGDILDTIGACEAVRLWKYPSKVHDGKRTQFDLAICQAKADGKLDEAMAGFSKLCIREMLVLLTVANNRMQRESLLPILMARLQLAGMTL